MQLTGDGRGGGHPSNVLGYYDAPSMTEQKHESSLAEPNETIGFNAASLAPWPIRAAKDARWPSPVPASRATTSTSKDRCTTLAALEPQASVRRPADGGIQAGGASGMSVRRSDEPCPPEARSWGRIVPTRSPGIWTVQSEQPLEDADQLLADFLAEGLSPARVCRSARGLRRAGRRAAESRRLLRDGACAGPIGPRSVRRTSSIT